MNPVIKNSIAVVVGIIIGMAVNMGIIMFGPSIIPYPDGVDFSSIESINAALPTYEARHFIVPFLAHALGTLVGAFLTAKIAANRKMMLAIIIGVVFLAGGLQMVFSLTNSPIAFNIIDIGFAYIPMAWLGAKLAKA